MRAFLAHSSTDKALVQEVADQLGRQFCLYDKYSFNSGEDFSEAIRRCLDNASVFVLFASKISLERVWVKFEIEEAYRRKIRQTISQFLVYIIDDAVSFEDIPEWLTAALIIKEKSSKLISRDIRYNLDQLLRSKHQGYYFGRGDDSGRLEELLTPTDGTPAPRAFLVHGLPGIGRKTLIQHVGKDVLGFQKSIEIRISEGDSINELCVKIVDKVESFRRLEEFNNAFADIKALSPEKAVQKCIADLGVLIGAGELPILIDEGGLLDNEGYLRVTPTQILQNLPTGESYYLAIVSYRRPKLDSSLQLPILALSPLSLADSKRLLARLFSDNHVPISLPDLGDIADYVRGYPPSAYFAVEQARSYGVAIVVSQKHRLVEFRTSVFLRHIESLAIGTIEGKCLQLLSTFSPLPLQSIVNTTEVSLEELTGALISLIDLSLVIPEGDGLFRIADPIAEAASTVFGMPSPEIMIKIGTSIREFLLSSEAKHHYLELSRVVFRAARLSRAPELEAGIAHLSNDLIQLTEEYYHARRYKESIDIGQLAILECPDSISAHSYLIRALAQHEFWDQAFEGIEKLEAYAPPSETQFLKGFVLHKQGRLQDAIAAYSVARQAGRKGAAISRELAQCYFLLGNVDQAMKELQEALRVHGDNRYVVDLWAQVSTMQENQSEAQRALDRLEVVDKPVFFYYRKSRIELHFGKIAEATASIQRAMEIDHQPPFSIVAQAALCQTASRNFDLASRYLKMLDHEFGDIRNDVRMGLHCRYESTKGNYIEALRTSERIQDKASPYYSRIRASVLAGLMAGSEISGQQKEQYRPEYEELCRKGCADIPFDITEIDYF
jgi:tetratricopeptide (TPR) repeat protein